MKSFESVIKKRIQRIAVFSLLGCSAIIIAILLKLNKTISLQTDGLSFEILIGFLIGILIPSILRIQIYRKALKNKDSLEILHIKENDERNRIIALKTSRSCIYIAFVLLGFAGIAASFFNRTIFLTIGTILIALLILYGVLALFFTYRH